MFTFHWSIENFHMSTLTTGKCIHSPTFVIKEMDNLKGWLILYPKGNSNEDLIECKVNSIDSNFKFKEVTHVDLTFLSNTTSEKISSTKQSFAPGQSLISNIECTRADVLKSKNEVLLVNILMVELKINCSIIKSSATWYARTIVQVASHTFPIPVTPSMLVKTDVLEIQHSYSLVVPYSRQGTAYAGFKLTFNFFDFKSTTRRIQIEVYHLSALEVAMSAAIEVLLPNNEFGLKSLLNREFLFPVRNPTAYTLSVSITDNEESILITNPTSLCCNFKLSDGTMVSTVERNYMSSVYQSQDFALESKTEIKSLDILKNMYVGKKFSDVTLVVNNRQFPAHKCVLGTASPVFETMFESDMKEKETSVVHIDDMEVCTVEGMLQFLYNGAIENFGVDSALELYSAADKYQIGKLKQECSKYLSANLCVGNACQVLEHADFFQDRAMEKLARSYIYSRYKNVFVTDEWNSFVENCPQLAADIMRQIYTRS